MHSDRLLKNKEFADAVKLTLQEATGEVLLISAFLRSEVLEWVASLLTKDIKVTVISRWKKLDILTGASDLRSFDIARENGWKFYIDLDLHAKALLCDRSKLFIGSANFTGRGTHLFGSGNNELNISVDATAREVDKVQSYLTEANLMTVPMRLAMEAELEAVSDDSVNDSCWSDEVLDCIDDQVDRVWVDECLRLSPQDFFGSNAEANDFSHDVELFGTKTPSAHDFGSIRLAKWLAFIVEDTSAEMRFGAITARLHDAFINDPKPYRKDVKEYVANLLAWAKYFDLYDFQSYKKTTSLRRRGGRFSA